MKRKILPNRKTLDYIIEGIRQLPTSTEDKERMTQLVLNVYNVGYLDGKIAGLEKATQTYER